MSDGSVRPPREDAWESAHALGGRLVPRGCCRGHTQTVLHLDFSVDGSVLMSNCAGREIMLWQMPTGQRLGATGRLASDATWCNETCLLGFDRMGIWGHLADGSPVSTLHSCHVISAAGNGGLGGTLGGSAGGRDGGGGSGSVERERQSIQRARLGGGGRRRAGRRWRRHHRRLRASLRCAHSLATLAAPTLAHVRSLRPDHHRRRARRREASALAFSRRSRACAAGVRPLRSGGLRALPQRGGTRGLRRPLRSARRPVGGSRERERFRLLQWRRQWRPPRQCLSRQREGRGRPRLRWRWCVGEAKLLTAFRRPCWLVKLSHRLRCQGIGLLNHEMTKVYNRYDNR